MTSIEGLNNHGVIKHHFLFICGNTSTYSYNIDPPIKNVIGIEVNSALIPRTEYTIESTRNTLKYNYNSTDYTIVIESKNYSSETLRDAIESEFSKNNHSTINVIINEDYRRFEFNTHGTSFTIFSDKGLSSMLGIRNTMFAKVKSGDFKTITSLNILSNSVIYINRSTIDVTFHGDYSNIIQFNIDNAIYKKYDNGVYLNIDFNNNIFGNINDSKLIGKVYTVGIKFIENTLDSISVKFISVYPYNYDINNESYRNTIYKYIKWLFTLDTSTFNLQIIYKTDDYIICNIRDNNKDIGILIISNIYRIELIPESGNELTIEAERFDLSGTDVVTLKSNLDSFINGGKENNLSAPLAKFYVNDSANSQYVQNINYEQPSRTFFPIYRFSNLELSFFEGCTNFLYNFHGIDWYLHIIIKTVDYQFPKMLPTVNHKEEITEYTEESKPKKSKTWIYIIILLSIIVFIYYYFNSSS